MPTMAFINLAGLCVAAFMMPMDITIVSLALPYINAEFNSSFVQQQLIIAVYNTAFTFFIITAGRICRNYGAHRVFMIGCLFFAITSTLAGISPSTNLLIASRVAQGVCGALVLISSTICITSNYKDSQHFPLIIASYTSAIGAGIALGPFIGATILELASWRWVFLINLPIMLLVMIAIRLGERKSRKEELENAHESFDSKPMAFLFLGTLFYFIGFSSNAYETIFADAFYPTLFSLVCFLAFIIAEKNSNSQIIEWRLFRKPEFTHIQLISFSTGIAFWATLLFLPIFLQVGSKYTAGETALAMLPSTLPLLVFPFIGARLATKLSARRLFSGATILLCFGNLLLVAFISHPMNLWFLCGQLMSAAGAGLINSELTRRSALAVSADQTGQASSANMAVRHLAFTVGVLVLGFTLHSSIQIELQRSFLDSPSIANLASIVAAGNFDFALLSLNHGVSDSEINDLRLIYKEGVVNTLFVSSFMALVCLFFSFFLLKKGEIENGTRG